jgi:protein translocase, SecG subunit
MLLLILNILFVLIAVAMVALILMQRGAGAQAGSGFGGGASATVFGARGSANFLSKSTKWLAICFFAITLFMAWYATHRATLQADPGDDLGVMAPVAEVPAPAPGELPAAPAAAADATVPAAPQAQPAQPAASGETEESPETTPQPE